MPYRYYSDMVKIPKHYDKELGCTYYLKHEIQDFCRSVYTHIRKPVDDYILVKHQEVFKDDRNTTMLDLYVELLTVKFKDTKKWRILTTKNGKVTRGDVSLKKILMDLISFDELNPMFCHSEWIPYTPSRLDNMPKYWKGCFNTFIPSRISLRDPIHGFDITKTKFHTLTYRLCGKRPDCHAYFYNWLAWKIQRPCQNMDTAIGFLNSVQGAGKGCTFEYINRLIGQEYTLNSSCLSALLGRFQSELDKKLLICLEELSSGGLAVQNSNKLKELVCKPFGFGSMKVEYKNQSGLRYINYYASYIFFSNNSMCLKLEDSDRRYFVVTPKLTKTELKDRKFWTAAFAEAKDRRAITGIYQYLAARDLSSFNPTAIPMTPLRREMMRRSEDNVIGFIKWLLKIEHLVVGTQFNDENCDLEDFAYACANSKKDGLIISRKHVFDRYKAYCLEANEKPLRKNIVIPGIFGRLNLDHDRCDLKREPMHRAGMSKTDFANNRKDCILFPLELEHFSPELADMVKQYKF